MEIRSLLEKCKSMGRKAKAERPIQWHTDPCFRSYFPSREISDKLVGFYLRTMESTHRILHIPSFQREYEEFWADPDAPPSTKVRTTNRCEQQLNSGSTPLNHGFQPRSKKAVSTSLGFKYIACFFSHAKQTPLAGISSG